MNLNCSKILYPLLCACTTLFFVSMLVGFASSQTTPSPQSIKLLSKLDPDEPSTYLRAGEELGARAQSDQDRLLAIETLAVGLGIASRLDDRELAASLCIALSSVESNIHRASALWDLALLLDPSRYASWVIHRDALVELQTATRARAAQGLYAARFHDPQTAESILSQRSVRNIITEAATRAGFTPNTVDRLIDQLIESAKNDPCKGRVFVRQRGDGQVWWAACTDPHRPIGASTSDESFAQLIQLELILLDEQSLSSDSMPWDSVSYFEQTQPSRDPSVSAFMTIYSIDLSKPIWKNGSWVSAR